MATVMQNYPQRKWLLELVLGIQTVQFIGHKGWVLERNFIVCLIEKKSEILDNWRSSLDGIMSCFQYETLYRIDGRN